VDVMQYEVTLPGDYDMGVIRERVARRGAALDDFAGLGLKAYLIRERGVDGSAVNQYAPFYLWQSPAGMNRFLWGGGGFQGIVRDFGRPAVRRWAGVALLHGPEFTAVPRAATRRTERLPDHVDPALSVERALAELSVVPGVHSTALAVDPYTWELVRFTLWADEAPPEGDRFRVLHLSAPALGAIETGRHW
jgi:hypothetical protein